jgi:ribosomal protein S18 acetylase RimI-like enzyme
VKGEATIRRASARDARALAALAERTFREAFAPLNTPEDMDLHCARSYGESLQAREIADRTMETFVAVANEELVAYGQLRWGHGPPCVRGVRPVEIQRFYVDSQRHGKGLAQAFMAALLERARAAGADVVWLGVWERNPRAIAFYAKAGFTEAGEQVFTLGNDPQRDLVLTRQLDRLAPEAR